MTSLPSPLHHQRSIGRIWLPALEVKPTQPSRDDFEDNESQLIEGGSMPRPFTVPLPPPTVPQLYQNQSGSDESGCSLHSCHDWNPSNSTAHPSLVEKCTSYLNDSITIHYDLSCKTPTPRLLASSDQDVPNSGDSSYERFYMTSQYTPEFYSIETTNMSPVSFNRQLSNTSNNISSRSRSPKMDISPSPETLEMLQEFLRQHSNGHIMYRRPSNCPSSCSSSSGSTEGTVVGDDQETFEEDHEYSRMLLGQTPEPDEFEFDRAYDEELARKARIHKTDTPVFYKGFPLMNRRKG